MKISKLFHWLYAFLMILPFIAFIFNLVRFSLSGSLTLTSFDDVLGLVSFPEIAQSTVLSNVYNVYSYLIRNVMGFYIQGSPVFVTTLILSLTYWTGISIIWLVFDIFMYVPLLVHRWIDKAVIE